jgi:hypothetical protein
MYSDAEEGRKREKRAEYVCDKETPLMWVIRLMPPVPLQGCIYALVLAFLLKCASSSES